MKNCIPRTSEYNKRWRRRLDAVETETRSPLNKRKMTRNSPSSLYDQMKPKKIIKNTFDCQSMRSQLLAKEWNYRRKQSTYRRNTRAMYKKCADRVHDKNFNGLACLIRSLNGARHTSHSPARDNPACVRCVIHLLMQSLWTLFPVPLHLHGCINKPPSPWHMRQLGSPEALSTAGDCGGFDRFDIFTGDERVPGNLLHETFAWLANSAIWSQILRSTCVFRRDILH